MNQARTPTEQQLNDARAFLASNPTVAANLKRAGITVEQFAVHGDEARASLAERHAAEQKERSR